MTQLASWLKSQDWYLRSGHASGADWAFEQGAQERSTIYLPWPGFGTKPYGDDPGRPILGSAISDQHQWYKLYDQFLVPTKIRSANTPASLKALHGRNVAQVLGASGKRPSQFVICWCPEENGIPQGGTATALLLARDYKIPVFNLYYPDVMERIQDKVLAPSST